MRSAQRHAQYRVQVETQELRAQGFGLHRFARHGDGSGEGRALVAL